MDHPFPPNSIFWADLVDWAVCTLSVLHPEELVLPAGLDLSCPSSLVKILERDTMTWLEVLAKNFLVLFGFSTGCSFFLHFLQQSGRHLAFFLSTDSHISCNFHEYYYKPVYFCGVLLSWRVVFPVLCCAACQEAPAVPVAPPTHR